MTHDETDEQRKARQTKEHFDKYEALAQKIGIERLIPLVPATPSQIRAALETDFHLNNIPILRWDRAAGASQAETGRFFGKDRTSPVPDALRRHGLSLAERVCVLKHVAREYVTKLPDEVPPLPIPLVPEPVADDREQLADVCERHNVQIDCVLTGESPPAGFPRGSMAYEVTLMMDGRALVTPFHQGSAHKEPPTAADVLYCLILDLSCGEQSFEEFCSEMGADTDSRKAYATWETCSNMAPKVREFLGKHFDEFAQAEH